MKSKSEYTKAYKPTQFSNNCYLENLLFRIKRREDERSHHPIEWPGSDSSDSEIQNLVTITKSMENLKASDNNGDVIHSELINSDENKNSPPNDDPVVLKGRTVRDESIQVGNGNISRNIVRTNKIHKNCNNFTCQAGVSILGGTQEKSKPFTFFGYTGKENIGDIKTYNVTGGKYVHPSALRASENRRNKLSQNLINLPINNNMSHNSINLEQTHSEKICNPNQSVNILVGKQTLPSKNKPRTSRTLPNSSAGSLDKLEEWKSEYNIQYPVYPLSLYARPDSVSTNHRRILPTFFVPALLNRNNPSKSCLLSERPCLH